MDLRSYVQESFCDFRAFCGSDTDSKVRAGFKIGLSLQPEQCFAKVSGNISKLYFARRKMLTTSLPPKAVSATVMPQN